MQNITTSVYPVGTIKADYESKLVEEEGRRRKPIKVTLPDGKYE